MNMLDQQLQDLCDIHGLTSVSIHAYNSPHGKHWGVNVHTDTAIGHAGGRDKTTAELFAAAVLDLRARQGLSAPSEFAPLEVVSAHEAGRLDPDPFYTKGTAQ